MSPIVSAILRRYGFVGAVVALLEVGGHWIQALSCHAQAMLIEIVYFLLPMVCYRLKTADFIFLFN